MFPNALMSMLRIKGQRKTKRWRTSRKPWPRTLTHASGATSQGARDRGGGWGGFSPCLPRSEAALREGRFRGSHPKRKCVRPPENSLSREVIEKTCRHECRHGTQECARHVQTCPALLPLAELFVPILDHMDRRRRGFLAFDVFNQDKPLPVGGGVVGCGTSSEQAGVFEQGCRLAR